MSSDMRSVPDPKKRYWRWLSSSVLLNLKC